MTHGRAGVSVVLCTYNGARYLPEQLDSLARQSLPPTELVVRDDDSTDETASLVAAFAERAPFPVRWTCNAERLGPTRNFGAAIADATGEFVALCDQDDVWLPEKLERVVGALMREP
ncbi:MAG: glycosyltransferase, partial [Gemmatimonadales bacterium]